jgi:type II secretion system protein E
MTVLAKKKLGRLLCEKTFLGEAALVEALTEQQASRERLGQILLKRRAVTPSHLVEALADQAGLEMVDVEHFSADPAVSALVPIELILKHRVLPLRRDNGRLAVAMADPFDLQAVEDLRVVTGLGLRRYYSPAGQIERVIERLYGSNVSRMLEDLAPSETQSEGGAGNGNGDYSPAKLNELAREPSLVNLVNLILLEAIEARASDVHIEPFANKLQIKYRIDGLLMEKSPSSKRLQAAIVSRIKIMAGLNIAEHFVPQDGHIEYVGRAGKVDIRVSTVPTIFGESVTMRILDRSAALMNLEDLGMNPQSLVGFEKCLNKAHGIVLVTGPTGSGKTTTLYAALNKIYSPRFKIITIEDPVEYQLEGVIQMPVNPKRGLTFATGLRHILRQDPDIIMVGEIRDRETADIAIRAALTGHLVFSTLHTNDAAGAINRLIDMGVEPFLLGSSLEAVLAQRLVRTICPACKSPYQPDEAVLRSLDGAGEIAAGTTLYRGAGCTECNQSGMRGRTGIFELLRITNELRQVIAEKPTTSQVVEAAPPDHVCMRHDGLAKVLAGVTTPEEVLRVTQGIDEE